MPPTVLLGSCPYCNWDLDKKLDEIDAGDKMVYLTAFMGGGLFHKSYLLFGKRVEMTFRELTTQQAEDVMTAVSKAVESDAVKPALATRFGVQLRMMLSLISIRIGDVTHNIEVPECRVELAEDDLESWRGHEVFHNETMWHTAQDAFQRFTALLANLTARAHDENF
jgi:hypothetical protein